MSDTRKYRKFTAQQKTEIVLASLRGSKSLADLCREHEIADSLLRKWREQFRPTEQPAAWPAGLAPFRPYGGVVRGLREADGRRPALMRGVRQVEDWALGRDHT